MNTTWWNHGRAVAWVGAFFAAMTSGCESAPPEPVEFTEERNIEATVTAVDVPGKQVTLAGPSGNEVTLRVPQARNLAQLEVGDTVRISYFEAYRASMAEPGQTTSDTALAAGRAPEGERPGAFVGAQVATTVEIVSVADDGGSVSFRDESGQLDSMTVRREPGRAFARELKRGDMVVLEYAEAVAIEVEAAPPSQ